MAQIRAKIRGIQLSIEQGKVQDEQLRDLFSSHDATRSWNRDETQLLKRMIVLHNANLEKISREFVGIKRLDQIKLKMTQIRTSLRFSIDMDELDKKVASLLLKKHEFAAI